MKNSNFMFLLLACISCAEAIPTPSAPCAGMYCLEWSGHVVGLPGAALICAKTELEVRQLVAPYLEKDPKSVVRKLGAK